MELSLAGHTSLHLVLVLLALKLFATTTTIASGGSGGVFAPGLFMGAMLGSAFGMLSNMMLPLPDLNPGIFAVAGMAAVFAGSAHAPITAMVMLFELTGEYRLILPLVLATIISTALTTKLFRESIYTAKAAKRGIDLIRRRAADKLSAILVEEAMEVEPVLVPSDLSVEAAISRFTDRKGQTGLVQDVQGQVIGSLTCFRLLEEMANGNFKAIIETVMSANLPCIKASETLSEASIRMRTECSEALMVVNDRSETIGLLGTRDIVQAYRQP